jgi:putative GTP pyrophosphokinase
MSIYEKALNKVLEVLNGVEKEYCNMFDRKVINHTTSRIKAPKSIMNKMKKKNLELNYKNLVNNIHDIAGVRVVCPAKDDIYTIAKIIEKIPNWNVIRVKDYIKDPKKSGYSGYHIIVEVPVKIDENNCQLRNQIFVKVEIQIRTMAMDFWATNEHKMKYKTNKKVSFWDSKRLIFYAKVINIIDDRFVRIGRKQRQKELDIV